MGFPAVDGIPAVAEIPIVAEIPGGIPALVGALSIPNLNFSWHPSCCCHPCCGCCTCCCLKFFFFVYPIAVLTGISAVCKKIRWKFE